MRPPAFRPGRSSGRSLATGSQLWAEPVVVRLAEVCPAGGAGPPPTATVTVDGPVGVGLEDVPAASERGEVVARGRAAGGAADGVVEVGGGSRRGSGGGVGGVPVAQRHELRERR